MLSAHAHAEFETLVRVEGIELQGTLGVADCDPGEILN